MSWVDSMRARRVAATVRAVGWTVSVVGFAFTALAVFGSREDDTLGTLGLVFLCVGAALVLTHGTAWFVDRYADKVVSR